MSFPNFGATLVLNQERYEKNLEFVQITERYNRYLVSSIERFLGNRVLDVGCGTGNLTKLIRNRFVVGIDCTERYLSQFKKRLNGIQSFLVDIQDTQELSRIKRFEFDTVLCSNVLEHVKDDILALRNMHDILVEGGRLVLLVPSWKSLYGSLDQTNLHFRRYSKSDLLGKIEKAGFKVDQISYLNFPGVIWWLLHSKILKSRFTGQSEAGVIDMFVPVVKLVDKLFSKWIGLTLVAVAKRYKT
jgi:2-polyprenyl-3-methyl-5-hydroxy-6-metoxy-1,4-benzoquinol methylase